MNYMANELSIWEIAVLALLREAPMHPYQMQRLLRLRHKDEILALKRGSLYHAITRLLRAGHIALEATGREGRRPERTTYSITPAGSEVLLDSLRKMISAPRRESSEFMAALSFLLHVPAQEALERLAERARNLEEQIAELTSAVSAAGAHVLRINLVESEYLIAMLRAELAWVRSLEDDLRSGKLTWDIDHIFANVQGSRDMAAQGKE